MFFMRFAFLSIVSLLLSLVPAFAQEDIPPIDADAFSQWLDAFRQDARSEGISQATLDDAFSSTIADDRVITLDRKQPESTFTLPQYMEHVITPKRLKDGRKHYQENRKLLAEIGKKYGVQPRFIVALWGIETNYGSNTGGFSIIDS